MLWRLRKTVGPALDLSPVVSDYANGGGGVGHENDYDDSLHSLALVDYNIYCVVGSSPLRPAAEV